MKVMFKKHGNFFLYGVLPLLFLVLTVALIQLTPKVSRTAGETCDPEDDVPCIATSSLGEEFCNEETGKCQTVNVGCIDGVVDQTDDSCVCLDDDGEPSGNCIVCPGNQEFDDSTKTCAIPSIVEISGTSIVCSMIAPAGAPGAWLDLAFFASFLGALIGHRKDQKKA